MLRPSVEKWNRIVAGRAERMAAGQPPDREPAAAQQPVPGDRFRGVVRATGQEPAGSSKIR